MSVLLDTHAALWLVQGDPRLSEAAAERIAHLDSDETCVSDLLLFELGLLVKKGRVVIDGPLQAFMREFASRFHILPADADIATLAVDLEMPQSDPFDRIFVATARRHKLPLVTRDREMRESGLVETVW